MDVPEVQRSAPTSSAANVANKSFAFDKMLFQVAIIGFNLLQILF